MSHQEWEICEVPALHEETVAKAQSCMLSQGDRGNLADFFKNLADSTRLGILWALSIEEMCVCDLAALLGMTQSAVSHQLRTLRQARLVKSRREGKSVFYSLSDEHPGEIMRIGLAHMREEG